ncbi:uncharacterized protein G2W53_010683 [Senna tora]|uniref:Uncharacterized protein n=1 Tax=Senna tora TaxID=362788 RepID=A0A834X0F2_9FABA|nr:uncharacterized protein G2W53_010683 [Senna tora]
MFVEWSFGKNFDVEVEDSISWKVKNGLYKMNKAQANQEDDRNLFAMEFDRDMNEDDNLENKSEIDQNLLEPREKNVSTV